MFKLISKSLPKSNRSLTKYSNIYKKILSASHCNTSQQQKNGSKTHSRNTEDHSQRGAKKFEVTYKTSRTFSSSCVGKTGLKFLRKSLFPEKCTRKVKLVMFSTSSSKYFYSSTMNQTKDNSKKYFKNHRALELYKKAFEQCMKIKFEKHRIDRANNKIGWTPDPFKISYPQELVVISDKKKTEDTPKPKKSMEKSPKQVLRLIPKKSLTVKEMAQKRKVLEQNKLTFNKIKKRMKIVYPSHIIKHNLGLSTSYHVDKSVRNKIEILSNAKNKRSKKTKAKVQVNTLEVVPFKQELNQNMMKVISAIKMRRERICDENAQTDDAIKHLISQHPTVQKATKAAKMAINKKYNVILLKSQAKVQLKMLKPYELVKENVTTEGLSAEELKTVLPLEANETIFDKMSETPTNDRNQPGISSKITQHPILPSKFQEYPEETVRYPKRILVDKTETFDIDGVCLRTKESYVAYVDEVSDTLTKIPCYQERKEQEKIIPEHRKSLKLKQVETQDNILTKKKPDNIDAIKKNENLIKHRPSLEKNQNLDAHKYVSQPETQMKTVSPNQSLLHYLKKLNELKDQTSVDRLSASKYPNRMSNMVENLEVKKINNDGKNKITSGERADVKENVTVCQNNERGDKRIIPENVTKLQDINETNENVKQTIKDDRVVEKKIKRSMNSETVRQNDSIEKKTDMTSPKSEKISMEETHEIHPSEVKPLYEKLLERNREQVSASERKKFKLELDQNISKRKSEAKRKVITPKVKPNTELISVKPSSAQKTSKYLLENYQPITETMATEKEIVEKGEKVTHTENKIFKKILQQYTVISKTDTSIEANPSIQDKQKKMEESEKEKVVSENKSVLENNFDNDVHVYGAKTPQNELKIHSIAVEKQNYSGNDLTSSTETSDTKDVRKDYNTLESKYTDKLKNLLEPANQYLEKLREAGENQMKSLGELKTQFKNQLSENFARSLKIKQMIDNINRNEDKVTKVPGSSDNLNQQKVLGKYEKVHKNQLISNVDSSSNAVETLPNEFMDKNILDQQHRYKPHAYQTNEAKDVTKSENPSENSEEEYGIEKTAVELKKPLQNRYSLNQASDNLTARNDGKVKTTQHLSEVNRNTIVNGMNLLRKEHIPDDSNKIIDEDFFDSDLAAKETFLYILKEKEPEQDELETDIVETKNKVDGENEPTILKEILKYNDVLPDPPGDNTNHKNLFQNQLNHSPEKSLPLQKTSVIEHSLSSSHLRNINNFENDQLLNQNEDFSQPIRYTKTLHSINEEKVVLPKVDESDGDEVIEPSSEQNRKLSFTYNSSQNFVLLHNRPTIRKENPPPKNPKTDNNKREKPKTKKDFVLPPPKSGDTPKMVEGASTVEDTEKSEERIRNFFSDETAGNHSMEESKYIAESQYTALESEDGKKNHDGNMEKVDLEDIVFGYRSNPRYDQNKILKNWITILAFIEELKITYKDGSDANLIEMSKEINLSGEKSDREELKYAKLIPIDIPEHKEPFSHQNEMTTLVDSNDVEINLSKLPQEPDQSFGKAIVENNNDVKNSTRSKPEKTINNDDNPTSPKDSVFPNSLVKTEKPGFLKNNEEVLSNRSKQLFSDTKIDEIPKDHRKPDTRTESTTLSINPVTTNEQRFPKKIKWPPKTKKFKFPSCEKKIQRDSMKKSSYISDEVSEPKLSRRKVWRPRESSESKLSVKSEKLEVNKKVFKNEPTLVQPSVSHFLEDNLENWKSMNKNSEKLFSRDSLSETKSLISKTDSSLLKSFLLDEDEEIKVAKIIPNENQGKNSPKTKQYLTQNSKDEGSYFHLNSPVEKSGENVKESKSFSPRLQVDNPLNSSKSEEVQVSNKIVHPNSEQLSRKHSKSEQREVSNSLEKNLKTWKLLKPNMSETYHEVVDERSTDDNNPMKFSRLLKMFSLDESEYPESSKHLKRAHTTITPELRKKSYQNQRKLWKEYENFKSTSRYDNKMYNKKVDELKGSKNNAESLVMTRPPALKKKQEDRCYEDIHSKKTYHDLEKYKTGNSAVELNKPKKIASLVPPRLKTAIIETKLSSKSTLLKKYSLENYNSRENAKKSKKTEFHVKSIEDLNKMEKTTECFSLFFRKAGHLNRTGMKKEDDGANTKELEGKPSNCLVTLTLPKINNGKLKQAKSSTDSREPSKGYLEKILEMENSDNYPKDMIVQSLNNVRRIKYSSLSSSGNGECQKGKNESSNNNFDGNDGDNNGKKGAPKLLMRVLLPKNRHMLGNKENINGIQLQQKEPDAQKDGKAPGKLKKTAIFKLSRTFGLPVKYRHSENKLENILKVSKVYDKNTSRNLPLGTKNSNSIENSRSLSNKQKASLKIAEENQVNLKDKTLREMYSTLHLKRIMDKYKVNTEKLQYPNHQNVVLTEVELFERRRSKERLLEAFNKKIKKNSKIVRNKVETITMDRILHSMKKQNKSNSRSQKAKQVKFFPSYNTLNGNNNSVMKVNAKKSLPEVMIADKTKHGMKQHQYQGKQKLVSDIDKGITARSGKVERVIKGIKGIQKSNKQTVKKFKFFVSKPKCYGLEYRTVGQEKEKRSKKNTYPSKNTVKHKIAGKRQKVKAKYVNYCLQDQLRSMNKEKPTEEKEMNTRKQTLNNTNHLKVNSTKHDEPKRKHDAEKNGVKKITTKTNDLGKHAKKISNKYLLERPMSSQCLDFSISEKETVQISPDLSTQKVSVYRPSSSKYSLEKQTLIYKNSTTPNEQFNNVTKNYSADEMTNMEGKFETRDELIEEETRKVSRAKLQEVLPKISVVMDSSDFGERIMDPDRSSSFLNEVSGSHDYNEHRVVAIIKNIFANGKKNSKVNKKTNSVSSTMPICEHQTSTMQMKFRHFNKFLIAEQKSGTADNGKMADIDQQRTPKMEREIPERATKLLNRKVQQNPISKTGKIPGVNENITSMEMTSKGNNTRCTKVVVEKKLPVYPLVESKAPKQAVTKFCYQIQIPPKSIMQVFLSQPRSDVTTLTENPCREIMSVPKKSNTKGRNLKITYIRVNRKPEKFDESFLPALMTHKEGNKISNGNIDIQMNKEQILKLRYQLLKQLREEFEMLNNKQIDRMLQSGTEKSDNKSEFKFKLTENKAIDDEKSPKNNTEMLIEKLSEKDRLEKKGKPEKPEDDPKKK